MSEEQKSRLELVEEIQLLKKELIRERARPLPQAGAGHRVLEAAVEASLSAMAMAEPTGEITYVNPAFMGMWGYNDRTDVLGRSIRSLAADPAMMEDVISTLNTGCGWVGEVDARNRDGSMLTVDMRACMVKDRNETPICMMASFLDVTENKEAEAERERLISELQDAIASIKTLKGLIPICSWCRKLRDDQGYWKRLEEYLSENTGAELTHGMCPECYEKYMSGKMDMGSNGHSSNGHNVNGGGAEEKKTKQEDGAEG